MKFAVFDHLDRSGPDLGRQYEDRLRLIELYQRWGKTAEVKKLRAGV